LKDHSTFWRISWSLTRGDSGAIDSGKTGGWVIQEIIQYYRDATGWQELAPDSPSPIDWISGRGHYYEAWNVLPGHDKTTVHKLIQNNAPMEGKPGAKWRDEVNDDAARDLRIIADPQYNESPLQRQQAQELLGNVMKVKWTHFASADDRFGVNVSYWQSKLGGELTGWKLVGRAVFVQKNNENETLQQTFGDAFNYNNNSTGAGPFIQSIAWSENAQIRMTKFLKTHRHSAGIDHILQVTWAAGNRQTTAITMGP
jgi:hypothetical protein